MFDRLRLWLREGRPRPAQGRAGSAVPCEEALARVYEYLDGELSELSPEELEDHFRGCASCYPHLLCEKAFRQALRRAGQEGRCPEQVRQRILEALERE